MLLGSKVDEQAAMINRPRLGFGKGVKEVPPPFLYQML
jgi:hypothetical protein